MNVTNFLKYSGLTYSDILQQINDKVANDLNFANLIGSPIFDLLTEIFAGTTDLTSYYLQRRAEECYFDTLQLRGSAISLSRMFSYDVSRSIPAKSKLKIILEGDFSNIFIPGDDNKIQLPYFSKFSINGYDYVLVDTWTYNITSTVLDKMVTDKDQFKLEIVTDSFENDITIAQGEIKEKVIEGVSNNQVNALFQIYKIDDLEFSNLFGEFDYFHNKVTQIYVGQSKTEENRYTIDRKSLINWETFDSIDTFKNTQKICVLRTSRDENVELLFGDNKYAKIGAATTLDNVYIQYLATKGSIANAYGVIGNKVDFSGNVFTNAGVNITNLVKFQLASNITNGSDMESKESIIYGAPKMFYSQGKVVNLDDYLVFLKTLKSPIVVRNAIAWGEQEERDKEGIFSDIKMFNVIFFSVLGSLYDTSKSVFTVKNNQTGYEDIVLDMNYNPDEIQTQSYFNIYIRRYPVNQLRYYNVINYYNKITSSLNNVDISNLLATFSLTPARLEFYYNSSIANNASNIIGKGYVDIDLSSLTTLNSLEDVANLISLQLESFLDSRSNTFDNYNYKKVAFLPYTSKLAYVNDNNYIEIAYDINSPCVAYDFFGNFAIALGIDNKKYYSVAITSKGEISGKITSVVNNLQKRAQLNVKNIYISPIIQNFNLDGKVVVSSLVDKESLKNVVKNSIYGWLDLNADFNVEINMYDINKLISKINGVENVSIKLVPDDITIGVNNFKNKYYFAESDYILRQYTTTPNNNQLFLIIKNYLKTYLQKEGYESKYFRNFITSNIGNFPFPDFTTLEYYDYKVKNFITERSFYKDFVNLLYEDLLNKAKNQNIISDDYILSNGEPNYKRFIGFLQAEQSWNYNSDLEFYVTSVNSDFVNIISKIHKDLSYIIRLNMLDLNGNIKPMYDQNNKYVIGGYSLGSEIPKISLEKLKFEYK